MTPVYTGVYDDTAAALTEEEPVNKAQLVTARLGDIADHFGPVPALAATLAKTDHALPGSLWHGPITIQRRAEQAAEYTAEYGNYPAGMSLCEVAGINGDAADGCPFAGTPDCTCDPDDIPFPPLDGADEGVAYSTDPLDY